MSDDQTMRFAIGRLIALIRPDELPVMKVQLTKRKPLFPRYYWSTLSPSSL